MDGIGSKRAMHLAEGRNHNGRRRSNGARTRTFSVLAEHPNIGSVDVSYGDITGDMRGVTFTSILICLKIVRQFIAITDPIL